MNMAANIEPGSAQAVNGTMAKAQDTALLDTCFYTTDLDAIDVSPVR